MSEPVSARPDEVAESAVVSTISLPERLGYRVKRALLGPPLISAQLHEEKLSKRLALGVLSSDCISSSAYGSEEMLIVLLGVFGLAGFHILAPMTAVILVILVLMTLSYREVVMVYTRAGGSYVVCRENFGYKMAQVAAVALLIDYIVTVAVQTAAGVSAIASAVPSLAGFETKKLMAIGIVVLLAFGNLRGIREAGKAFAFPTYFFFIAVTVVIVAGVIRKASGGLQHLALNQPGQLPIHDKHYTIFSGLAIFYLLKAFANGGASLTGLEAISDGVSAFKAPNGPNARRTLVIMATMLGFLVCGVGWLAMETHAAPYSSGTPTVISQVAKEALGHGIVGTTGYALVTIATALVLITGANTPFTGFPFLANFVAEDSFLPRQLTRRGHRLAYSNGIIALTLFAIVLLALKGADVNGLVPFYSLGVFTGFTLAGFGMAKYHTIHKEPGWKRKWWINASGGALSSTVVLITAVVKFKEGAWVVLVLAPLLWLLLMRLNQQYRAEARSLDLITAAAADGQKAPHYARHVVLVLVDRLDLAVIRAIRYAGSLRPTELRAVHISLDSDRADALQREWIARGIGERVPLEVVDCPDRRLIRTVADVALSAVVGEKAEVTLLLPRRTFRRLSQRLLHDRTADRIASAMAKIPHVSATIVPFDTTLRPEAEQRLEQSQQAAAREPALAATKVQTGSEDPDSDRLQYHSSALGVTPIGGVSWKQRVVVEGRIKIVQVGTTGGKSLEAQVFDDTGGVRLVFFGRTRIPGITPGAIVRASGTVGEYKGHLALANPRYELIADIADAPAH